MKHLKCILALPAFIVLIYACSKEDSTSTSSTKIVTSKSEVRTGETVSFAVVNGPEGAIARWSVTPTTNVVLNRAISWDQKNTITFNGSGNYTVNVELKKVWCDSVAASHPGMDTCINSGTNAGNVHATIVVKN